MKLQKAIDGLKSFFEDSLSDEKIFEDFRQLVFENNSEAQINVTDEKGIARNVRISIDDNLVVLSRLVRYSNPNVNFMPLIVLIGIGDCETESGNYRLSKLACDLIYNDDLELIDVEFVLEEAHTM